MIDQAEMAAARLTVRPWIMGGMLSAMLGTVALCVLAVAELRQVLFAYLVAWTFGFTIAIGALAFSMIGYITHARWLVVIRRLVEAVAVTMPLFALLFLPIALFAKHLYVWAAPASSWSPALADQIASKRAYLDLPFWYGRAAFFFALWSGIALLLRHWSLCADDSGDPELTGRRRMLSGALAPALAISVTFAAFDWLMSLDPTWTSNAYGFYLLSASLLAAAASIAILAHCARRGRLIPEQVGASHFLALGNIVLAMTIFWAYIAFVQMMLIWIADLPQEVSWYITRSRASWQAVCWMLAIGHFVLPFFALLNRRWKRNSATLVAISAWLLVAHYVDMYWLIMPTLHPDGVHLAWRDVLALTSALAVVSGAAASFSAWRFARVPSVPRRDTALVDSLRFELR